MVVRLIGRSGRCQRLLFTYIYSIPYTRLFAAVGGDALLILIRTNSNLQALLILVRTDLYFFSSLQFSVFRNSCFLLRTAGQLLLLLFCRNSASAIYTAVHIAVLLLYAAAAAAAAASVAAVVTMCAIAT